MARRKGGRRGGGIQIGVGVVTALALMVAGAGLVIFGRGGNSSSVDDATAEGLRAGQGPVAAAGRYLKQVQNAWSAGERMERLEQENLQLRQWRETALALAERMDRYEALLRMPPDALGAGTKPENVVSARLILDAGGAFKRTMLANAGSDHGVRLDYIVINENGLVGRVVSVGRRSSRVLLVDDFNSRIPVMGLQSRVRAMLSGDASTTPNIETGAVRLAPPKLDHQVPANALRAGERIVTSGDGGIFPRGLHVGLAEQDSKGQWRVRLAAASAPIDFVRILPFASLDAPELAPVNDPGAPMGLPQQIAAPPPPPPPVRRVLTSVTAPPPGSAGDDAAPPAPDAATPAPDAVPRPPQ